MQSSLQLGRPSLVLVDHMQYTPKVYIDPNVQPPLPNQDVTEHPNNYKTSQADTIVNKYPKKQITSIVTSR